MSNGNGGGASEHLPRLQLDQLLEELQARIDAVRGARDRVHSLLEAVLAIGSELDLPHVLRRIVEAATVLVDAEYGALGVIGEDGKLSQFIPVGLTEEQIKAIGPLPAGHGLLGELIKHPEPLRLPSLADHPASSGFPPHHPPMRTFLGAPIRIRGEVFGNLYLTEKRHGQEFDSEDETVLETLAVAAGVAVENARLYQQARAREQWLEANAEITASLLSGTAESDVLRLIVDHARRILGADLGLLAVPVPDGSGALRTSLAVGSGAERHHGLLVPREGSFVGAAVAAGEPLTSPDISNDPRITAGPPRWAGMGPAVAVPMRTREGVRGVLVLARADKLSPFTDAETAPLLSYAGQAALAMELADRRRDAEQITLLEDRDRIARDLHDLAIQRLFATGISLQSAVRFVEHPQAQERLLRAVDDLDETTRIIRTTIFGLRSRDSSAIGNGLRVRIAKEVEKSVQALGFTPSLRTEGLIDTDVPPAIGDDVVAVLAEALTNVARHARAGRAEVALEVGGGRVVLTVRDDGVGLPEGEGRRSGLRNLAERARRRGGEFTAERLTDGGTRLVWSAPLSPPAPNGE
ncbi:sensor histidine kinase [Streptomyces alkaliterrae]|uniref:GAF domain-containing protein n=1 Tax=Streptomyces alkaliterrae TaxID=2213162 RepID=A0A5P0YJB7_9ACTN|nr:GAF domain-containing protein [Streptomyces alkaliterrae]MBB1252416.1 GAF domain-containing protein [Streptomyces alkaliterrae]MBB1258529.1 GAF domain-containing protein [Streptomyces alkaliterrae]MQS00474.1 GAF domain-containing protein [Streptomyces alkaliterrae]